jgi:pectate lyase
MTAWIDSHGFLVILICFIFATVMSSAPKDTPKTWGFWKTWGFNAFQALGANAGNYANTSPLVHKLQATETTIDASGTKTETATTINTTIPAPQESPK